MRNGNETTPRMNFGFARQTLIIGLLTSASAIHASEVTVRNDSFESGQSAVIVGNFVPGEQAGVRLTSPCTGTIVAVQIGWLAGQSQSTPSVERAIHIYAGNGFPSPGTELAFLEAPALTAGFLNEFRYLDENNSVPISVPVTLGQQFYVTLEFDEPTDVGGGGPSVFRDLNGCQGQKNVLYAIPGGWQNFCLYIVGDLVIRAVVDCAAASGACCLPDGTCQIRSQSQCTASSGVYHGDNSSCANANCPQPSGACCFQSTGGCVNLTQANCAGAGGIWKGAGTNCATTVCFPHGACCLPDGSCMSNVSPETCSANSGVFQGNASSCATVNCPLPQGACCFPSSFCLPLIESDCAAAGGAWSGIGSNCADANGDGIADACQTAACEPCDANCDGSINQFDIQSFISALQTQSGCSPCVADTNNDGTANQFDIQGFLECLGG